MSTAARPRKKTMPTMEESAREYLTKKKKWRPEDYRLEIQGLTDDQQYLDIWAIYLREKRGIFPGGGKSVSLYMDPKTHQVVRELHFQ